MSSRQRATSTQLIAAIDQRIDKVRSRPLDISFNELLDMHRDNELIIDPEYQRLFRWSEGKQSRFIESLLLEMPIPPLYVVEIDEGKFELIDGLQRISSYLHFRGAHPDRKETDGSYHKLELEDCDIAPELNGSTYDDLPQALQIKLKRNFIRMEVIRKESDQRLRYYVFKRLNTGGEILSDQEIRNCTIRLLDDTFNKFIIRLSDNSDYKRCIGAISEEKQSQRYDQELVLRFFAFKNYRDHYVHDVGDFMTDYMEAVSDPANTEVVFDYGNEELIFKKTFRLLANALGAETFAAAGPQGTLVAGFRSYHYEAFTLGIQSYLERINPDDPETLNRLKQVFMDIKRNESFRILTTGGGRNYSKQLAKRIRFIEERIQQSFES